MALIDILADLKLWVVIGIIAGLLVGSIGDSAATIIIIVLIIQMSVSFEGLSFKRKDMREYSRPIVLGIVCCFFVNSGATLLLGSLFIPTSTAIWYGWVMVAAVPSAVSVVSASLYLKGDTKATVLMTSSIYLAALAITPLISWTFTGSAVSPLEILKYILLFILIPLFASQLFKRFKLPNKGKIIFINIMLSILLFLALGVNREYIFGQPDIIIWIIVVCFIKTFVIATIMLYLLRRKGTDRDMGMIYILFSVWKNTGMATSLSLVLLPGMAGAAIPGAISLIVESIWFSAFISYSERMWPREENSVTA
ncbi:MAG TPA: Na+-dependent transporter [Candidatus Methanomethylophilaceae archaeon]|nr:Na+-dependent transporter [Candidatus Methanomethylophilaceae archaeon]